MKTTLTLLLLSIFFVLPPSSSVARKFELPRFNPKDAISSKFFNEIMERLEKTQQSADSDFLSGSWSCTAIANAGADSIAESHWSFSSNQLYLTYSDTVTFQDSTISADTNLFNVRDANALSSTYELKDGLLMFKYNLGLGGSDITSIMQIQKLGDQKIRLINVDGATQYSHLICDKQNLPPKAPSKLTSTLANNQVSLTWTDNSDNETEFKIYRKNVVTEDFTEVTTTTSNSYSETLTSGKYWYRVVSVNSNGESHSSNVVKVEID